LSQDKTVALDQPLPEARDAQDDGKSLDVAMEADGQGVFRRVLKQIKPRGRQVDYLQERASRGDQEAFHRVLEKVKARDREPLPGDEMP
jgi:hypothetical protein